MAHSHTTRRPFLKLVTVAALAAASLGSASSAWAQKSVELLNVSYDPTREFYAEYNPLFI
jgi:ABC-type sulfate transport system substrate-binding protein